MREQLSPCAQSAWRSEAGHWPLCPPRPLSGHLPISCGTAFQREEWRGCLACDPGPIQACRPLHPPGTSKAPPPSLAVASPRSPPRLCHSLILKEQNHVISLLCSVSSSVFLSHHRSHRRHSGPQSPTPSGLSLSAPLLLPLWPLCCSSKMLSTLLPRTFVLAVLAPIFA